MHRKHRVRLMAACAAALFGGAAHAQPLWLFPPPAHDGQALRDLLAEPAGWPRLRARSAGIGYADHWLNNQFGDAEQRGFFAALARWRLGLALEVGALKPWGTTAEAAFAHDRRFWDRFVANGARIASIGFDEPLGFALKGLGRDADFAAAQTARFAALARRAVPGAALGDIEPYPGIPAATLLAYLRAVQQDLRAAGERPLDFVRLDVDWMHFRPGDSKQGGAWPGVAAVAEACRRLGLRFEMIYWAADLPALRRAGEETATTWETGAVDEARRFAATGIRPDAIVVESWLDAPAAALPEDTPGTFAHSALAVADRVAGR